MAKLIFEGINAEEEKTYQLKTGTITIGRDASNAIVLSDPAVSSKHAEIAPAGESYRIQDLHSTNGVFLNNERVEKANLRDGDRIRLGNSLFIYQERDDATSVPFELISTPFSQISLPLHAIKDMDAGGQDFACDSELAQSQGATFVGKDYRLLSAFYKLSRVFVSDKSVIDLMRDSLLKIVQILEADTGMTFLFNKDNGHLEPFLALGGSGIIPFDSLRYSKTILKKAMDSREAILTADATQDERFKEAASVVAYQIHSAMCVPLCTENNCFGLIQIDLRSSNKKFNKDHLEVLAFMAKELAVYLENSRLKEDLQAGLDKLLGLDRVKYRFLSILGHKVATPVTILTQWIHLLRDEAFGPLNEKMKYAVDKLVHNSGRLVDVVGDLERISSWDMVWERMELSMKEFDIRNFIEEALEEFKPFFNGRSQEIRWLLPSTAVSIRGDRDSIKEVLTHILVNAYQYTPEKAVVEVELKDSPEEVLVRVEDNGRGMTPDVLRNAFDIFFMGKESLTLAPDDPVKRWTKSMGLGLALSKRIVEAHHGRIWAESEPGEFARFYFTIPKNHTVPNVLRKGF